MSTIGVVIMIVLLLCLELVAQKTVQQNETSPENSQGVDQMTSELEEVQARISKARENLISSNQLLRSASAIPLAQLSEDIENFESELHQLNEIIADQKQKVAESLNQAEEDEMMQTELDAKLAELEKLRMQQSRLKNEIDELVKNDLPVYKFASGEQKTGFVVVISDRKIEVSPIGKAPHQNIFESKNQSFIRNLACEKFLSWVTTENDSSNYYFLVIRPDGTESFERISKSFDSRNIRYGFDVIGQHQRFFVAEKGGAL